MEYKKLWTPDPEKVKNSQMYRYMQFVNEYTGSKYKTYDELWQWSVGHPAAFWGTFWHYSGLKYSQDFNEVVDDPKKMPGAKWFTGARLNFAENLLQRRDDHPAIIFRGEDGTSRTLTFRQLYEESHRVAEGLKRLGVQKGDRVAAFMPNIPETVIAMLAAASIGAIWSSTSPDFGIKGVLDRFSQIEPKVIFSVDGYYYNGKHFDSQEKLRGILGELPTIETVVMVNFTGKTDLAGIPHGMAWESLALPVDGEMHFEQLPFDHPLYIMYSSGTTGLPKSIVHSAGGTLIQHLKELKLHCDVRPDDVVFYFTTCGWMMWNWFVSSLAVGATIVCFDGNPFYPAPDVLIRLSAELKFTLFGTSAKYIASLQQAGVRPVMETVVGTLHATSQLPKNATSLQRFPLGFPSLRAIASTGSPLADESFDFVYNEWQRDVQLSSISGGTDIISCFMLGNPMLPVYRGEIQCRGLGMDVDCFDDNGNPVRERQGELVCKTAFPSMPVYFWNDPDGKKYFNAYFDHYPGIWYHGDYMILSRHGGITMLGRSDATLNPGGVRIGTSEIYRVVENMEEIDDSVVVGQQHEGDERVILFVKMKPGFNLDEDLAKKIKSNIRSACSPRHVPAVILTAPDIPYTINGKKVEVAVKKLIHGQEVKNSDALRNAECLEFFRTVGL
ncbi:MAG TPA: acetoacetate--CoA ligase [Bacteroidales bacterium]|nr:acetoacetate--CoA ligase [Bacteroidales bacterium]